MRQNRNAGDAGFCCAKIGLTIHFSPWFLPQEPKPLKKSFGKDYSLQAHVDPMDADGC